MKLQMRMALILGLGMLFMAGCLITGSFVLSLKIDDEIYSSNAFFDADSVDLTVEQIWIDHQDDIKNISDVRFRATIFNETANQATGQVYFSSNGSYTTPDEVRNAEDAFIVFGGMVIGPNDNLLVTFKESAKYRTNLDRALVLIEDGKFYLYVLTPEDLFELRAEDVYIMVTMDAGPTN